MKSLGWIIQQPRAGSCNQPFTPQTAECHKTGALGCITKDLNFKHDVEFIALLSASLLLIRAVRFQIKAQYQLLMIEEFRSFPQSLPDTASRERIYVTQYLCVDLVNPLLFCKIIP
jgi:hypothetical protein